MRLADACAILDIDPSQPRDEAQKAYRKLALRHHPDRSDAPDATSRFQTIGEAWERVQQYHDNPRRWGMHADPPEEEFETQARANDATGSFEEMFARWFGGMNSGQRWAEAMLDS